MGRLGGLPSRACRPPGLSRLCWPLAVPTVLTVSTNRTVPTVPTVLINPTDPAYPANPANPTDPTYPTDPANQTYLPPNPLDTPSSGLLPCQHKVAS